MRSFAAFSLAAIFTLPVAAVACGGAAPSDLLVPPGTTTATGGEDDSSAPSDATTTVPQDVSTPQPETSAGDDSSTSIEAGPGDAMTMEAAVEAGPSMGLECTNGTMTVYCPSADICCITASVLSTTAACGAADTCLGSQVHCASSADCMGGQVCCATEMATGFTTTYDAECSATCTGLTKTELCDPSKGMSGGCPSGDTCSASTALPGYSQCR